MHDDDATRAAEELRFDIKQALRKARPFFPAGRGRGDDDNALSLIAETVVEHLKLCRWQLNRLPPVAPHGIGARDGDEPSRPKPRE